MLDCGEAVSNHAAQTAFQLFNNYYLHVHVPIHVALNARCVWLGYSITNSICGSTVTTHPKQSYLVAINALSAITYTAVGQGWYHRKGLIREPAAEPTLPSAYTAQQDSDDQKVH